MYLIKVLIKNIVLWLVQMHMYEHSRENINLVLFVKIVKKY